MPRCGGCQTRPQVVTGRRLGRAAREPGRDRPGGVRSSRFLLHLRAEPAPLSRVRGAPAAMITPVVSRPLSLLQGGVCPRPGGHTGGSHGDRQAVWASRDLWGPFPRDPAQKLGWRCLNTLTAPRGLLPQPCIQRREGRTSGLPWASVRWSQGPSVVLGQEVEADSDCGPGRL